MRSERSGREGAGGERSTSATPQRGTGEDGGATLWGARADFVASLGRKLESARDVLIALEGDPSAPGAPALRAELRRKLSALGVASRLLRFDVMSRSLATADALLEGAGAGETLDGDELFGLAQILDELPALAWSTATPGASASPSEPPSSHERATAVAAPPISALVFGDGAIAAALRARADERRGTVVECECAATVDDALKAAQRQSPDVVLIDAELAGASELVEALLEDPLTEPLPLVVLGEFRTRASHARYQALGVAKTLFKPVDVEELCRACEAAVDLRAGRTLRITLGEPTVEQLGERLADEMRRALVECVSPAGRSHRVPLGEGAEVLGAVWGAIARVREVVTARTGGAVSFGGGGPEGAVALAPWLHDDALGTTRALGRARGSAADVRLDGRRVVVADDDPGVTWFLSDLLRAAGCEVYEALDGGSALELCYRTSPELVISDILMPKLDGFGLARALKHDVVLRGTPVILLSWKEDLLQRVRELGAGAAAYLRKESDSRAILARVREVLRPRVRVETRLRGDAEVQGRLGDLTFHNLLAIVSGVRPNARVSVRDASYLYEVEVRDGAARRATQVSSDGTLERGERVIATLLGIGAGRFVVTSVDDVLVNAADAANAGGSGNAAGAGGGLTEVIARRVAAARGALHAVTGKRMADVHELVLDEATIHRYLRATPEPTREVVRRLAKGATPRALLLAGEVAPGVLEDVLASLASHGAVTAVKGATGDDLLGPAVGAALAVLEGKIARRAPASAAPKSAVPESSRAARRSTSRPAMGREERDDDAPSSLADAVMRELQGRADPAVATSRTEPSPKLSCASLTPEPLVPIFEATPAPTIAIGGLDLTRDEVARGETGAGASVAGPRPLGAPDRP